ncbi:MAG: adenylate/guanylate cyclase domain-containing protein [Terricaulis sp.]
MAQASAEKRAPRFYWLAVAFFTLVVAGIFYARPPILSSLRALAFDAYQHISPALPMPTSPIRVVQIDESSLARIGQWPWPRSTMAQLTQKLADAGAAAIVFDVLFPEPDRTSPEQIIATVPADRRDALRRALGNSASHDAQFADVIGHTPSVLAASLHDQRTADVFPMRAGLATAGDDPKQFLRALPGVTSNLPILTDAAHGIGFVNWIPDSDQIVRRVPLLLRQDDQIAPALSLEALRLAVGASTYVVRASNASGTNAFGAHTGISDIKIGPLVVPTDAEGEMWLHFRPWDVKEDIPAWQVLAGGASPDAFRGTIVLIGSSAPGLMDLRATPLDSSIPGVEIHRQALEQIVGQRFLTRPDFARGVEFLTALFAIAVLAIAAPRLGPFGNAAVGFVLVAAVWGLGLLLFVRGGYLFDPIFPTLAAVTFGASATTYFYQHTEHQRAGIRRAFSQYVSPTIVRELTAHPERLTLGGEVRTLTVLMCDIRNFSSISERLNAQELTSFINSFLTPLTDIIIENGGTIDKYMGDAIMAFWNAPIDQADHAARARKACSEIIARMKELNAGWRREAEAAGRAFEDVRIGIGVNTGECCVGNLGSERRFDYSAIGDAVNIASRLEGLTKVYGLPLLISEETAGQAGGADLVEIDLVRLKGREGATRVYTFDAGNVAPGHGRFLETYRAGRFDESATLLETLKHDASAPLQPVYAAYAERLTQMRAAPPTDWDGVFDPQTK